MASTKAEATPSLPTAIQICYLISSVLILENKDVLQAWHEMFKSAAALIDQISPAHVVDRCDAQEHGETCAAAYALLQEIDYKDIVSRHLCKWLIYVIVDHTSCLLRY